MNPAEDFDTIWMTLEVPPIPPAQPFTASIQPDTVPSLASPDRARMAIELRGELARGGMGVVHLGLQVSLRREVAVKVIHRGAARSRDERVAIREALVTAYLEHPNIVPVYGVEEGVDGEPLIVMKRIDGVTWSECIGDPKRAPRMRGDDPLAWHLDVFAAVCRAVQFAHDRGILHRDIKPDNVLIGHHGDVYLLDWGLAVALDPALTGRVPLASEITRISGTPGYMAPEMLTADGASLGPATDVYLLGATLHEILTGESRHPGTDLDTVLRSTHRSEPYAYGDDVPAELAAICNRATSRETAARFPSVAELAAAVRDVERKQPALRFLAQARSLLERLRRRTEAADGTDADLASVYEAFGQCRSAIDEALRVWPGHGPAVDVRDDILSVMADFEMGRGNTSDAADLLAGRSKPDPSLEARLEALRREAADREREYARLKALESDLDLGLGVRIKALIALVFGAIVLAHNVLYGRLRAAGEVGNEPALVLAGPVALIAGMALVGFVWRRAIFRNQANRQILYVLISLGVTVLGIRIIGAVHGTPVVETFSYLAGVYALGAAHIATMTDRRVYAAVAVLVAGAVGSLLVPSLAFEIIGTSVFAATAATAFMWWASDRG